MQGFPMDSHVTWTKDPDTGAVMPKFDRAVTSEPLREYIKGVITNGVLPNPSNNLQVSAGTNGMTVLVNAGFCVIEGGLAIERNTRTLEVTSADSTYDRIDTVVARWDSNDAVRRVDLHIKVGVPASTPVRPTLTRNESIYELGLADVFVTKGVATITNEKITDTRMESARCGIVSSVSEWDTTTIYQQIQSDLAGFKSNEQAEFMTWFDKMKDQLTEDAAGKLQTEIDDVSTKFQNLQIGGRNLIKDSKREVIISNSTFIERVEGFYVPNEEMLISDNTTVTISADVKTNGHVKSIDIFLYDKKVINISSKTFDNLSTNYTRLSVTFTTKPHITGEDWSLVTVRFDNNATDSEGTEALLYIRNPKLELGNIPTDWTPAPEDMFDASEATEAEISALE